MLSYQGFCAEKIEKSLNINKRDLHIGLKKKVNKMKANFLVRLITEKFTLCDLLLNNHFAKDENLNLVESKISHLIQLFIPNDNYKQFNPSTNQQNNQNSPNNRRRTKEVEKGFISSIIIFNVKIIRQVHLKIMRYFMN